MMWENAPDLLDLLPDEVHVWQANLPGNPCELARFWPLLAPDERARAERYRFARDRDAFITARGLLRSLLSRYLGSPPETFRFHYGPWGKPALTAFPELCFNLAHSHQRALFAFGLRREVGVDIEWMRPDVAFLEIAQSVFSPCEQEALASLPPGSRCAAFYACWSRKEAYIKALGKGLACPLASFDVTLAPDEPARLLAIREQTCPSQIWTLRALVPDAGYAGAIVAEGRDFRLRCLRSLSLTQRV